MIDMPDLLNQRLIQYGYDLNHFSKSAYESARWAVLDSFACIGFAYQVPACRKLLGDWQKLGAFNPESWLGLDPDRDPIKQAFDISLLIRWLDYNDTFLGQEWGHPSDNLGAIFSAIFIQNQTRNLTVQDLLSAVIKAYEIQGELARINNFHQYGLDHVILVKLASCVVSSFILGLSKSQAEIALSHVWMDGPSVRVYRHGENTISRKSWAAADASARGFQFAWMVLKSNMAGAMGARTDLKWGFEKVFLGGQKIECPDVFNSRVIENILFKVQYPIEFHAQTAVECAKKLYAQCHQIGLSQIKTIYLETHHAALEIICKTGPLRNPADRDHCLQYCVALYLVMGEIQSHFFSDDWIVKHPDLFQAIEVLRQKIQVTENLQFTKNYPDQGISHAMQIVFESGVYSERIRVDYPLGHVSRRAEAYPELLKKYGRAIQTHFSVARQSKLIDLWSMNLEFFLQQSGSDFFTLWH